MKLSIRFAHGNLAPASPSELGRDAIARVRMEWDDPDRGLSAALGLGAVDQAQNALNRWLSMVLPGDLAAVLQRATEQGAQVEAHIPAEVQAQLQHFAPTAWELLARETRVLQRDGAWRVRRTQDGLEVDWLPAGAAAAEPHRSPLLSLADELVRGQIGTLKPPPAQAIPLLWRVIESRWLTRRLPPALHFDARAGAYRLRSAENLSLLERGEGWVLQSEEIAGVELDGRSGAGLPSAVVRAALLWLIGRPRPDGMLFLDPRGQTPEEPGSDGADPFP